VVKGLLKQFQPDFNVARSWKRLAGSNGDRKLEWSPNDAATLKRKLEYHKGTAEEVALEARRLAIIPKEVSMVMTNSIIEKMIWPEAASLGSRQLSSFPASLSTLDTDMPDASYI